MSWNVEMSSKLRPCYVQVRLCKTEKALFHCWNHNGAYLTGGTVGIVELEDGQVTTVLPECLRFADNAFSEYTWNQEGVEDV